MGHLDDDVMRKVNDAISISFGLNDTPPPSEVSGGAIG